MIKQQAFETDYGDLTEDAKVFASSLINLEFSDNQIYGIFFASARLKIEIKDRFGRPVIPQEWFCVPFERIEEAIERIKDKSIQSYKYDVKEARLIKVEETH